MTNLILKLTWPNHVTITINFHELLQTWIFLIILTAICKTHQFILQILFVERYFLLSNFQILYLIIFVVS